MQVSARAGALVRSEGTLSLEESWQAVPRTKLTFPFQRECCGGRLRFRVRRLRRREALRGDEALGDQTGCGGSQAASL